MSTEIPKENPKLESIPTEDGIKLKVTTFVTKLPNGELIMYKKAKNEL